MVWRLGTIIIIIYKIRASARKITKEYCVHWHIFSHCKAKTCSDKNQDKLRHLDASQNKSYITDVAVSYSHRGIINNR